MYSVARRVRRYRTSTSIADNRTSPRHRRCIVRVSLTRIKPALRDASRIRCFYVHMTIRSRTKFTCARPSPHHRHTSFLRIRSARVLDVDHLLSPMHPKYGSGIALIDSHVDPVHSDRDARTHHPSSSHAYITHLSNVSPFESAEKSVRAPGAPHPQSFPNIMIHVQSLAHRRNRVADKCLAVHSLASPSRPHGSLPSSANARSTRI